MTTDDNTEYQRAYEAFERALRLAMPGDVVPFPGILSEEDRNHIYNRVMAERDDVNITQPPLRVKILREGAALTAGERDKEYGPPRAGLTAAGEFKLLARKHAVRDIAPAEWEALDLALTKFCRLLTGGRPKRDTYVDAATYIAIAGEMALDVPDVSVL